ncbi:hypothetical protein ACFQI7_22235 [Paenibacillus allorhizosphaerae]|uniref:hypothetical protein n=2 Tax=Paenibacillus allorhizosphaerae TaxID=2849866 RepID=UPI0036140E4E
MQYFWILICGMFLAWPSFFIMSLVLFRQKVHDHVKPLIISSILMGHIALLLQLYPLQIAITLVQPIFYIFCLSFIFKFKLFYSTIMALSTYFVGAVTEICFNGLITNFKWDAFLEAQQNGVILPAVAVSLINFAVAYILNKTRIGFTFIPRQKRLDIMDIKFKKKMNIILVVQFLFVSVACVTLYRFEHLLILNFIIDVLLLIIIFRLLYVKELTD